MSSNSNCNEEGVGFCLADGTPFAYGKSWWTGAEPDNMPDSCAAVGGDQGEIHIDAPCADSMTVNVLCEIGEIRGGRSILTMHLMNGAPFKV